MFRGDYFLDKQGLPGEKTTLVFNCISRDLI
ncbi:DUF2498 family protein [Erwinia tracheiphila]|nr:DUF2498 family protein [Erwinia tracheiphila]UIA81687.1 DUF2498 family protein [Erwinia tracheiphila]UIA90283.1 DUF2498 family protein [Erwinia tracheiphila]